eukprot:jgi/Undpi1/12108/HiC_scaffold_41.g14081.m1
MNRDQLSALWQQEEQHPFTGWDFSYLDGRMIEEDAPWSYTTMAAERMGQVNSAIDLGTGGGERLLGLREHWPTRVVATEEYPPNITLSTERLAPMGVEVVPLKLADYVPMPFATGEFELVLNRHSGFNPPEVARILADGGTFLTQQIDGQWLADLMRYFDTSPQWPEATLKNYQPLLEKAGLTIVDGRQWQGTLTFVDVAALVYYLKAVPWIVQGFSVTTHLATLLQFQEKIDRGEKLSFTIGKYLLEARK